MQRAELGRKVDLSNFQNCLLDRGRNPLVSRAKICCPIVGPERLYGVVLRLPQPPVPSNVPMHRPANLPNYPDRQQRLPPNQPDYSLASPKEDHQALPTPDYARILPQKPPAYTEAPAASQGYVPGAAPPVAAAASQPSSVGLTPELIAALSKLVPAKTTPPPSSAAEVQQSFQPSYRPETQNYVPSSMEQNFRPPLPPPPTAPNSQGWRQQDYQVSEPGGNHISAQQQFVPPQIPQQFQPYMNAHPSSSPAVHQMQDPNGGGLQQGAVTTSSGLLSNLLQGGQFGVPPQHHHAPQQGVDASGLLYSNSPGVHQNVTNPVQGGSYQQNQVGANMGHLPNHHQNHQMQMQQQQQLVQGSGQPEEADKNQRYQSTLQFAANLLLQIQQKQQQQQANAQPGRGGPAN